MELKPLSLIISFRSNYASKLDNDTQILYWVLWDKWNYLRRPTQFNIDNNTLMIEANLKNYSKLNDKRKKLIEAGLIEYIPSKTRGKSSTYALIKNYVENVTPNLNQNLIQNPKPNPNTNLKQNPNKSNRDIENNIYIYNNARDDNISPAESQVLIFYQNRICSNLGGTPGANEIACLREYAQVYGAEQTIQALKKALQSSKKLQGISFVKYTGGILRGWANLKIAGGESNGQSQFSNLSRTTTQAQRKTGTDINWAELD
ncbi:hypothetical protein [Megamonas funiformis]